MPYMSTMGGGSQSHHSGKIRGNKKANLRHKAKGFRLSYGSSSGQSLSYSSSGSGSRSSLMHYTQCERVHSGPCLMNSGGYFRCG